jgi:hypothetical protein
LKTTKRVKNANFDRKTFDLVCKMATDLISNFAGIITNDRFEELNDNHLYASDVQSEQLFNLLREAENTEWGIRYEFKNIISYQDFRERIPVSTYEDLQPVIKRLELGESNITWSGLPKQILSSFNKTSVPVSEQALDEVFIQGMHDNYIIHLHKKADSHLFSGYFVFVGNESESIVMDELEEFLRKNEPFILSLLDRPKYQGMIRLSDNQLKQLIKDINPDKITCFKGTPTSLQRLINLSIKNDFSTPDFILDAEVLFHRTALTSTELFKQKSGLSPAIAVQSYYCSPEGFFGIQDKKQDDSFLLMLDLSQFYEFIPVSTPEVSPIPLGDVIPGIDYQLILTTCSGLWRYKSEGPHFRFLSTSPYRFILI